MKMLRKGEATSDNMPKEMGHLEFFPPSCLKGIHGDKEIKVFATHFPMWTLPKSCYSGNKLGKLIPFVKILLAYKMHNYMRVYVHWGELNIIFQLGK